MVSKSEIKLHIKSEFQKLEKIRDKLRFIVKSNVRWNTMFRKDIDDEQLSQIILKLDERGNFLTKSINIKFYKYSEIRSCLRDL